MFHFFAVSAGRNMREWHSLISKFKVALNQSWGLRGYNIFQSEPSIRYRLISHWIPIFSRQVMLNRWWSFEFLSFYRRANPHCDPRVCDILRLSCRSLKPSTSCTCCEKLWRRRRFRTVEWVNSTWESTYSSKFFVVVFCIGSLVFGDDDDDDDDDDIVVSLWFNMYVMCGGSFNGDLTGFWMFWRDQLWPKPFRDMAIPQPGKHHGIMAITCHDPWH